MTHDGTRPLRVRRLTDADVSKAASVLVEVHASDGYPVEGVAQPEEWLRPPGLIASWVAELDGDVVGHVAISRPGGEQAASMWLKQSGLDPDRVAVLGRLFVSPAARRRAAGEELMKAAHEYGQAHGVRLVLDVVAKDQAAMRLYERLGWKRIGRAVHEYGEGQRTDAFCYVSPES
ncbi:GNAT family N-acetyltransferase [Streptomyces lycii]|uniref:GNAT family N-acetyltransferase n=1 Tax=Streptomyces lycii TaxID=2654337 RepID=A0ABQ7FEE1_9ACTN|nr:GNAT family N-acetyltransferase [Streptomyces lycii]KAF4406191.1 GNAT family N-acetyltransferase [Streptomyces lycii]